MRSGGRLPGGTRRVAVLLALVTLLALAGCSAFASQDGTLEEPRTTTDSTTDLTFPDPPATLNADTARETATQHHLALLAQRLEAAGTTTNGSLPDRTAVDTKVIAGEAGYYALVTVPTDSLGGTFPEYRRAMYLLREEQPPISAYPIQSRQVETSTVSGAPVEPRSLRLANFGPNPVEATVVLTRISAAPDTAYVGTVPVDSRSGVVLTDPIETAGQYRVTVAAGQRSQSRVVTISQSKPTATIGVYIGPDGSLGITRGPA